mmetsp:Transcript_18452/g.39465  ORF Transcript_18452/g.39465 Transcript_18452/m.39465 type:complete len:99 (+) Transcript_18452:2359-2655(+)
MAHEADAGGSASANPCVPVKVPHLLTVGCPSTSLGFAEFSKKAACGMGRGLAGLSSEAMEAPQASGCKVEDASTGGCGLGGILASLLLMPGWGVNERP